MPELPEVEHVVRALRRAVLGRRIVATEIHLPKLVSPNSPALFNRKLNEEMRTMTVRMGKKLGEMSNHLVHAPLLADWLRHIGRKEAPGTYPVGLGLLFAALGLPESDAFAVHQYGTASMILGASLRLMKVHHFDAQTILLEVNTSAEAEYARVSGATLDEMATFSPSLDIMAAAHVKAHVRMFMN